MIILTGCSQTQTPNLNNNGDVCSFSTIMGIDQLKALKYNEEYFINANTDYSFYLSRNIPNHRNQIAKARHVYNCECNPDYKFKDMCSK